MAADCPRKSGKVRDATRHLPFKPVTPSSGTQHFLDLTSYISHSCAHPTRPSPERVWPADQQLLSR